MTLILSASDVEKCIDLPGLIQPVGEAMVALSTNQAQQPLRQRLFDKSSGAMLACLPSHMRSLDKFAVKVVSSNPRLTDHAGGRRVSQIIVLADMNGRFLAIMHATAIGTYRTAAASAFAANLLARPDASALAVIGCGVQGRVEAMAMSHIRALRRITAFDIRPDRAEQFRSDVSNALGIQVEIAADARAAVKDADLASLATTSSVAVLDADWLPAGCHISALGAHSPTARELDSATVAKARVFVESREAAFAEAGDILIPIQEGLITAEHVLGEIGDVAAGRVEGRSDANDITLFKSTGMGLQDLAAANQVYQRAIEFGLGIDMAI